MKNTLEWLMRYSGSYPNKFRKKLFEAEFGYDERINKDQAIEIFKTLIESLQKEEETKDVSVFCLFEVIHGYDGESEINLQVLRDRLETKEERNQRLKKIEKVRNQENSLK